MSRPDQAWWGTLEMLTDCVGTYTGEVSFVTSAPGLLSVSVCSPAKSRLASASRQHAFRPAVCPNRIAPVQAFNSGSVASPESGTYLG